MANWVDIKRLVRSHSMWSHRVVFLVLRPTLSFAIWSIVLLTFIYPSSSAIAESGIYFAPTNIESQFPQSMAFETTIYSTLSKITSAWFIFSVQSELSEPVVERVPLELYPGKRAQVAITFGFERHEAIPGLPMLVSWEACDESGRCDQSEETLVRYEDTRFDWQVIEDDAISVWWHGHPDEFGRQIFDVATTAVTNQDELFQTTLQVPIRIMVYNTLDEFRVICNHGDDAMGGKAFPEYGITAQALPMTPYLWAWMSEVIPHEISHLYFAQESTSIIGEHPPTWLDEGMAQINESIEHTYETDLVQAAVNNGDLIPLTDLGEGFYPYHGERLDLAYAESYSAVQFMIETNGQETLADLFPFYRSGWSTDYAFTSVLGYGLGEFQQRWLDWLGTSMTFPATPTPLPDELLKPNSTATFTAAESSLSPTSIPTRLNIVRATPAPITVMTPNEIPLPCVALALPSGLLVALLGFSFLVWRKYRREC